MATPIMAAGLLFDPANMEQIDSNITITVESNVVTVSGAQGEELQVVSLTGRSVAKYKIEAPVQRVDLNNLSKGCYIIKIGKIARKVSIR